VKLADELTDAQHERLRQAGTASIRGDSTFIVQSIYGAIQAHAGFERPEWLD
jgi:hypothetical protein